MKNNNIKKNETPIKLRQLIDDCENYLINFNSNNKEHSILSFFSSNIFVKEKYLDLLSNSYNNLFHINIYFVIYFLLCQIVQICFTIYNYDSNKKAKTRILISEIITLGIIILSIFLFFLKKVQKNKFLIIIITWILFLTYDITILVVMYHNNSCEKGFFISKFYYYFISSHILMILMISANMSLHFGHFFIIVFLDIFVLIMLNITNCKKKFYMNNCTIILTALFTIIQSYKFELSVKRVFDFCVEKYYSFLINEETLENGDIGICLTSNDFEILKMNQSLQKDMSELYYFDKEKTKNYLLYNLILHKNEKSFERDVKKINLLQIIEKTINNYIMRGRKERLEYFVPLGYFKIKQSPKLFSIKFKRIMVKNSDNKNRDKNSDISMSEIFEPPSNQKINLNISKGNNSLDNSENILTTPYNQDHNIDLSTHHYNYKFIFTLISNNRKLERIKVEQIYQQLILTKVSNEFNTPVLLIQDLMDKLIKEKEDNEEKTIYTNKVPMIKIEEVKSPQDSQAELMLKNRDLFDDNKTIKNISDGDRRSLTSIKSNSEFFQYNNIETFLFVKYIADTIKNSAMDLKQYINIHSELEGKTEELTLNIYPLTELREYIEGIGNAYLNLMGKTINFKTTMDNILTTRHIEIDKDKLNQILSNLISNSIKNTDDNNVVVVNIGKMKERDLKYFEFGANKDIFENHTFTNDINGTDISNINIELGLVISIEDSGKGISDTLLNNINSEGETFYRVDTIETKINDAEEYIKCKGLGSGLKICKKLSDEMGIKLKCYVKPNYCGTIFKIYVKTELLFN